MRVPFCFWRRRVPKICVIGSDPLPPRLLGAGSVCMGLVNWRFSWLIDSSAGEHSVTRQPPLRRPLIAGTRDNNYGIMGGFCVSPSPRTVSANTRICFLTFSCPAEEMPFCSLVPVNQPNPARPNQSMRPSSKIPPPSPQAVLASWSGFARLNGCVIKKLS